MSKYRYMGKCAAGFVEFNRPNIPDEPSVVMPEGTAVEVPNWLEPKLATNPHFEKVGKSAPAPEPEPGPSGNGGGTVPEGKVECELCGTVVRAKKDGSPYKHTCVE